MVLQLVMKSQRKTKLNSVMGERENHAIQTLTCAGKEGRREEEQRGEEGKKGGVNGSLFISSFPHPVNDCKRATQSERMTGMRLFSAARFDA